MTNLFFIGGPLSRVEMCVDAPMQEKINVTVSCICDAFVYNTRSYTNDKGEKFDLALFDCGREWPNSIIDNEIAWACVKPNYDEDEDDDERS